ncbi:MAG: ComEC family competence protein [Chitinophagaceae bacterium]|nr:ComEC family competence protein [Chitinophagaceae bacterium]
MNAIPFWKKAPLLRLLPPLAAGILLQSYCPIPIRVLLFGLCIAVLICLPGVHKALSPEKRIIAGGCWLLVWMLIGAWRMHQQDIRNDPQWYGHRYTKELPVWLSISQTAVAGTKSFRSMAMLKAMYIDGRWKRVTGELLIYGRNDLPAAGTELITRQSLQPIRTTGKTGSFNVQTYYARQGIFHQLWLNDPKQYQLTGTGSKPFFDQMQQQCLQVLQTSIPGKQEAGVAAALLMGYRGGLDTDIKEAYRRTGVIHVIAISGLHLGMIYGLLNWLLGALRKYRWTNVLRVIIILTLLWGFALLAGGGPSVTRSAWMFSLMAFSQLLQRQMHALHSLSFAAFILLLINPYYLWDLGFLLSFAAVAGILFFQKPVEGLWQVKNRILKTIWQMSTITLSAQVTTLPIILYQFQQFPNLFLVANMVVIPVSGLLLYCCMALLPLYWLNHTLAAGLGHIANWGIHQLNRLIEVAAALPYAVTENIPLSFTGACTLYALMALPFCYQPKRKQRLLIAALGIVAAGMAARYIRPSIWQDYSGYNSKCYCTIARSG